MSRLVSHVDVHSEAYRRNPFNNGRLDLVEPVGPIAGTDDGEDALTLSLLGRQEVAHPARRIHG